MCLYCEVLEGIQERWMESEIKEQMSCWLDRRRDVLLPPPVRGMFQLLQAVDRQVIDCLGEVTFSLWWFEIVLF